MPVRCISLLCSSVPVYMCARIYMDASLSRTDQYARMLPFAFLPPFGWWTLLPCFIPFSTLFLHGGACRARTRAWLSRARTARSLAAFTAPAHGNAHILVNGYSSGGLWPLLTCLFLFNSPKHARRFMCCWQRASTFWHLLNRNKTRQEQIHTCAHLQFIFFFLNKPAGVRRAGELLSPSR